MNRFDQLEKGPQLLTWNDDAPIGSKTRISAEFAVQFLSTHGVPLEVLERWFNEPSIFGPVMQTYHTARAYDAAHGTQLRYKLKDLINA